MVSTVLFLRVIKGRALALSCHCKWPWISNISLWFMLMRKRMLGQNLLLAQRTEKRLHKIPKREKKAGKSLMSKVTEFQRSLQSPKIGVIKKPPKYIYKKGYVNSLMRSEQNSNFNSNSPSHNLCTPTSFNRRLTRLKKKKKLVSLQLKPLESSDSIFLVIKVKILIS